MRPTRIHPQLGDKPIHQTANQVEGLPHEVLSWQTTRIEGQTIWLRYGMYGSWEAHAYPLGPVPDEAWLRHEDFNPRRLTIALDSHALEGPVVDLAVGAVDPEVDWWESGAAVPTREQVRRCARLTGFPLAWFYKQDPPIMSEPFICPPC